MDFNQITDECIEKVRIWADTFGVVTNFELQNDLIQEESVEFLEVVAGIGQDGYDLEFATNFLKEISDVTFVLMGYQIMKEADPDNAYLSETTAYHVMGVNKVHDMFATKLAHMLPDLEVEAFNRVFESNMSKLDDNGKPVRNADGKVMKGANYKHADLTDLAESFLEVLVALEAQERKAA